MKNKSIIFMGTPEFAVSSLKYLIDENYNIIGVITGIDKKRGRGRRIQFSPIKKFALKNKLKVYQPNKLKDINFLNTIKSLNPDLFVVVAFRMLPEVLINIPKYGCINLHSSILPNYRGAAPINWVIINGEKETGVTTFFINKKIDEGDIINSEKVLISSYETAGTLHNKLMKIGANLVTKTVKNIFNENYSRKKQIISNKDKIAPKIDRNLCKIDLDLKANEIVQMVRGLSPYPGSRLRFNDKIYKIINCKLADKNITSESTMFVDNNKLYFNNNRGHSLEITEIQAEGKKIMKSSEYLRGNKL